MSTRTITREQAAAWGLPHDLTAPDVDVVPGIAVEVHREEDTGRRRWASENLLVFRAPDDGKAYRVTYFRGLTETQEDHDVWNDERTLDLTEVEAVSVPVVEWHRVGDKTPPAEPEGDTTTAPAPPGDVFTEAAILRNALISAANLVADPDPITCDCGRCAECALHGAAQRLRRLADHYTTAEQPTGPTWEARADHAVRLYARTAIELEDAKAEAARLRSRVTELEQQAAAPSISGITPSIVYVDELQLGGAEQCAQHPGALRIGDMCGGCTQYPTDMTEAPEDTIRRYARRLNAVEQLVGGRPGYHTVTVKQLLTAMSEDDTEQTEPSAQMPEPAEYSTGPDGEPTYHHRDVDGDRLLISPSFIPGIGIGLYFRTDAAGSSVPAAALPTLLARLTPLLDYAHKHIADEPTG